MSTVKPVRMVLDTDTFNEVDDQFALAYACLSPDHIKLEACYAAPFLNDRSSSPGDGMEKSYHEIGEVLALLPGTFAGPVFRGADRFLEDLAQPVESDAVKDLIDRAMASPTDDPLYVVGIAAATNLASALLIEPRIKERVRYVWLGGQPLHWPTASEFNLRQDVLASQTLFDSGVRFELVPCTHVAELFRVSMADLEKYLSPESKLCQFLRHRFDEYLTERNLLSKPLWDVVAIARLINARWVPMEKVRTPLLSDSLKWLERESNHGQTIEIATMLNRDAIFADMCAKLSAT